MGRSLPDFLGNLDSMHARLSLSMPELKPPSFVCDRLTGDRIRLEYWSDRPGLAPMITGLLSGLGEFFGVTVSVTQSVCRSSGADHDEFLIEHGPPASDWHPGSGLNQAVEDAAGPLSRSYG